jgi:hypothetical protein
MTAKPRKPLMAKLSCVAGTMLVVVLLAWCLVTDVIVWSGPMRGIVVETRGGLSCQWGYLPTENSFVVAAWETDNESPPLVSMSLGKVNRMHLGN